MAIKNSKREYGAETDKKAFDSFLMITTDV